jgi:hypothetical protein
MPSSGTFYCGHGVGTRLDSPRNPATVCSVLLTYPFVSSTDETDACSCEEHC